MFHMKNSVTDHAFSIDEVENLLPFERDIYVSMTTKYLKEKAEAIKNK